MSPKALAFYAALDGEIYRARTRLQHPVGRGIMVGVTGGRDYEDWRVTVAVFDRIHSFLPIRTLLHGNASGLDTLARQWAQMRGRTIRGLPARWRSQGLSAGPERNSAMLEILEGELNAVLVSFPGGNGTADMTAKTNMAGLPVIDVDRVLDQIS